MFLRPLSVNMHHSAHLRLQSSVVSLRHQGKAMTLRHLRWKLVEISHSSHRRLFLGSHGGLPQPVSTGQSSVSLESTMEVSQDQLLQPSSSSIISDGSLLPGLPCKPLQSCKHRSPNPAVHISHRPRLEGALKQRSISKNLPPLEIRPRRFCLRIPWMDRSTCNQWSDVMGRNASNASFSNVNIATRRSSARTE